MLGLVSILKGIIMFIPGREKILGPLGKNNHRAGMVTFRYPGGFVMIGDARQTKPSG